jgi:hypothetical protein
MRLLFEKELVSYCFPCVSIIILLLAIAFQRCLDLKVINVNYA